VVYIADLSRGPFFVRRPLLLSLKVINNSSNVLIAIITMVVTDQSDLGDDKVLLSRVNALNFV
jgi:hypothetical protein